MNFLLSLSSSWFSKLVEFILARFAVTSSPALLKRRSQVAEAGRSGFEFDRKVFDVWK